MLHYCQEGESVMLSGKKALVLGVANERSIAWAIAKKFKEQGAKVSLSYLNDKIKKRVDPLAHELKADFTFEMDVTQDSHYESMRKLVQDRWNTVDIVVHSLAFAEREDLMRDFSETDRKGFQTACDISAFSFIGVANALKGIMPEDSSLTAMTYHGSTKVLAGYNVMGVAKAALEASMRYLAYDLGRKSIRVNCISAGPLRTLASSAIPGLKNVFEIMDQKSPLRRNISQEDVADTAVYLAGSLSKSVTGQVLYVDSGISIMGI